MSYKLDELLFANLPSPEFLRIIDRYLLQNYPRLWSSRLHYLIFYGFWVTLLVMLCRVFNIQTLVNCLGVILFFGVIGTLIFFGHSALKYSVEREFGQARPSMAITEVGIYGTCVAVILTPFLAFIPFEANSSSFHLMAYILAFNLGVIGFSKNHVPTANDNKAFEYTYITIFGYFILILGLPGVLVSIINDLFIQLTIKEIVLIFGISNWLGTFFIVKKVIDVKRLKAYSQSGWNAVTNFPFSVAISTYIFLLLVNEENLSADSLMNAPYALLATLAYVPFLPYLKKQYMYLMALPRD